MLKSTGVLFVSEFVRTALLVSLLPYVVTRRFGLPIDLAALAISLHYFLDTIGRSPSGWLVDRFGPKGVLLLGQALALVMLVLFAASHRSSPFWLFVGFYGLFISPLWPVVIGRAATDGDRRGEMVGGVFALWLVAVGLGPVVTNILLQYGGARLATAVLLGVQVLAIALAATTPFGAGHPARFLPSELWRYVRRLAILFPGMFVQTMTLGVLLPVVNTYAARYLGAVGIRYAELLVLGGGTAVVLMVPLGRVADRLGSLYPLAFGLLLAAAGLVGLSLVRQFWPAVALAGLVGGAYALVLPAWNNFLAGVVAKHLRGTLWGLFMTVEGLGLTVGPILGAKAWDILKPEGPFILAALVLVAMGIFYLTVPLDHLRAHR